jgi:hypothetical protein
MRVSNMVLTAAAFLSFQVIRTRFRIHASIPATKVDTMRPVREVVDELVAAVAAAQALQRSAARKCCLQGG